ncbi:hypothetical protein JET18_03335 [Chryseobacterium sp. L7]|uniref:Uncharacterized protein n=1 Tax=Chryseobacterium endalhagicum TaxID=2797638 RepID=A0ABS1QDA5_9FLAO|nr:hypothetical protein [Chryseobacterium endalhagicum]MBL1219853.1 hypothetical protein [Chryseobacterium endalhagicum]
MKKTFVNIVGLFLLILGVNSNAQILGNGPLASSLEGTNYFFDGSNFESLANQSYGRGLGFPRTNLTTFQFDTAPMDNDVTLSNFDGMVVYNSATGNTLAGQGVTTAVIPGFYYFSNPGNPGNITNGRWLPIGGASPKVTIGTAETTTNTLINTGVGVDKQLFALKGTFTASGTSTAVNIPAPAGMTTLYGITIYKAGTNTVYDRSLYSYTVATSAGNAITGSPSMSVVYPSGTYDYVIEYLK